MEFAANFPHLICIGEVGARRTLGVRRTMTITRLYARDIILNVPLIYVYVVNNLFWKVYIIVMNIFYYIVRKNCFCGTVI